MFLILLVLWLVFAGSITISNLLLGALVSGLITLFCHFFMGYSSRAFASSLKKAGSMLYYVLVLLTESVKSNIAVIRFIYRKTPPQPELVHFRTDLKSDALKVLVANSITLTPGTYTVALEGQDYAVHALDSSFNEGIEDNVFFRLTRKMEDK